MNNNIKIYDAKVKSFESLGKKGDCSQRIIVDENSIFSITCVIDFENAKAINIESGSVYDIVPRDERGRIKNSSANPIKFNHLYVTEYKEKKMENISMLYGLQMKSRAKRAYEEYKASIVPIKSSGKVKVKTRKNG